MDYILFSASSYIPFKCHMFSFSALSSHIKGDPWNIFTTVSTSPMAISQWVLHKTFASAWPTFLAAVGWLCLRFAYRFRSPPPRSHSLSLSFSRSHISALFCLFWLPHMSSPVSHCGKPLWRPLKTPPRTPWRHHALTTGCAFECLRQLSAAYLCAGPAFHNSTPPPSPRRATA